MAKKLKPEAPEEEPKTVRCKVCGQEVETGQLTTHVIWSDGMDMDQYEAYIPPVEQTPTLAGPMLPIETSRPIPPPPPPAPAKEPTIAIRLAQIESNPFSCDVEARRGVVYHFDKKGKFRELPAPDAYILLGGEGIPPRYPYLQFERKRR